MNIQSLQDESKYQLVEAMPLDELKPFIVEHIKKKNKYARGYMMLTYGLLIATIAFIFIFPTENKTQFKTLLMYFGIGIAMCFSILIVLHELIHGIAFKLVGAPKVSYGGSLKEFVFYAAAHQFVADKSSFFKVALAPFIIISL